MAKTVSITITPPLDCDKCDEVLLEVYNPLLIAANIGLPDPNDGNPFIRAKMVDLTEISEGVVNYVFEYDETLLTDPDGGLTAGDIKTVCCVNCTLRYLDTFAICEIIQNSDPTCLNGVTFFDLVADSGSTETIVGGDTMSLLGGASLTTVASNPDTVVFDVVLSTDAGNILTFGTDTNLFLDCPAVLACINVVNPISGDGSGGSPFGIDISADAGNIIELRPDGLYADEFDTNLTCAQVLACINVENPITGDGELSTPFGIAISATAGNNLVLNPDGLYVATNCTEVLACINVANPISGDGSGGSPFTVDISAVGGNSLVLNGDGLYVPSSTETITTMVDIGPALNGARVLRYRSENATDTQFARFPDVFDFADPCNGVGANNMLKQFTVAGNPVSTLTIRSAPEVAASGVRTGFLDNVPIPLTVPGTFFGVTQGPFIMVNPFTCRRAAIQTSYAVNIAYSKTNAGGGSILNSTFGWDLSVNAGPFVNISNGLRVWESNGAHTSSIDFFNFNMDTVNGPLAIGGNITASLRTRVTVNVASPAGSQVFPQNGGVGADFFSVL